MSDSATSRYAGFGQGLASYFARADPMLLGVLGPVSTARAVAPASDPLAVGVELGATMVLLGHEIIGDSGPTLVMELFRVDDGTALWRGEFRVGPDVDLRARRLHIGAEVTGVLDLPRGRATSGRSHPLQTRAARTVPQWISTVSDGRMA